MLTWTRTRRIGARRLAMLAAAGALASLGIGSEAQSPPAVPDRPLTLSEAVELALARYPVLREQAAREDAAEAGVGLARRAYLPSAELHLQLNRATRNNVFGMVLPNRAIPGISGPVLDEDGGAAWGSAAGALLSWNAIDFGYRSAELAVARQLQELRDAEGGLARLDVARGAAAAFLAALGTRQTERAAEANVERLRLFAEAVTALVDNDLRPAVDASRARAELARARTLLIEVGQRAQAAELALGEWLGVGGRAVTADQASLADLPTEPNALPAAPSHPLLLAREADVELSRARRRAVARADLPRLDLVGALYARGTGALLDGSFDDSSEAWSPDTENWALGLAMSFPILELERNRVRRAIEQANEEAARARYDLAAQRLEADVERATAALAAAREAVANVADELAAARALVDQSGARYRAGLATVVEVAEAQQILAQAETGEVIARTGLWGALLDLAAARGDVEALLALAGRASP